MVNVLFVLIPFLLVISLFSSLTMMYNGNLLKKHSDSNFTYLSDERYKTVIKNGARYRRISLFLIMCCLFLFIIYIMILFTTPKKEFHSRYEPGSDGYYVDTIAYENPTWSYEKCEDFLFLSEEEFKEKY